MLNLIITSPHGDHPLQFLLSAVSTFLIVSLILWKGQKNKLANVFSLYTACLGFWLFGLYQLTVASNLQQGLFWGRFLNVAAVFIPSTFFHFVVLLTEPKKKIREEPAIAIGYLLSFLYATISPTSLFISGTMPRPDLYYFPLVGKLYPITMISFFVYVVWGHIKLFKAFLISTGVRRNHFKYVFVAYAIAYTGGTQAFLPMFGIKMIPYCIYALPVAMGILGYAVIAHRLMDISVIIRKTLIYSVVMGTLIPLYLATIAIFAKISVGLTGIQTVYSSTVAAALISFCFQPLRKRVQQFVDKKFFRQYVDREEKLYELSRDVITHTTPEAMGNALQQVLMETFHPKMGRLYVRSRDGSGFSPATQWGLMPAEQIPDDNPMAQYFLDHPQPFLQDLSGDGGTPRDTRGSENSGAKRMMANWAWLYGVIATLYIGLGAWVFLRQKNPVHGIYGVLCVLTAAWQIIWILVSKPVLSSFDLQSIYLLHSAILFVPAVFYHFILKFTGDIKKPLGLKWAYGSAVLFTVLIWTTPWFFNGFYEYSWGRALRAGPLHPIFSFLVILIVARIFYLLAHYHLAQKNADMKQRLARWVIAAAAIYCGGSLDLLSNYGLPVFPLSFLFCGVALGLFSFAIFRYEFLAIGVTRESEDERLRREAASTEMQRLGMTAAFPLVSQGELLGFLLLGEKMSEEAYSKEDLLLLRIVANQAALGYQRVRFLEMAVHGARTEMLGEIAGGFAHEIKTPLANISLPAELSLMDLIDVEKGKRRAEDVLPELKARLKDIMTQAFKASEKIEAIRQFSKPGQVRLMPVELIKIFNNSLGLLDHLLKKHRVRIVTHFPAAMSPIRGDGKQLEIVFVNLIKNAVEAMGNNVSQGLARELVLSGREESDWIIASVKDSGPGIKRADFGHLFEAYFTTKGSEGTGMGLFLSHQVIKAHGGAIDCKSEEGQGTEFIIRLPKFAEEHMGIKAA